MPARTAVQRCWHSVLNFAANAVENLANWWQPEMVEQMLGDLRKAGLDDVRSC